jgi:hypothetical protein
MRALLPVIQRCIASSACSSLDVRATATAHDLLFHLQVARTQRKQSGRLAAKGKPGGDDITFTGS